jgi:20S proteasome subunit beta 2
MPYDPLASGFAFNQYHANDTARTVKAPTKTGTTICGVVFSSGVVLGADTRSTNGETVADKNCAKIHYLAPNMFCCGAGTAADTEAVTGRLTTRLQSFSNLPSGSVSSELLLHRSFSDRPSKVVTALTILKERLFKYQGHIGAALVLGGVDGNGPHIFSVYPHGSSDSLPYATMGSGSLAAMAVLESEYQEGLDENAAKNLVTRAIKAGIFNDLGSGSNVDLCVITKDGAKELRNHQTYNERSCNLRESPLVSEKIELNTSNLTRATAASTPINTSRATQNL